MDNITAMAEFTEVLMHEPDNAYDFISDNTYRFDKSDLANIIKELLYSLHCNTRYAEYKKLYVDVLQDAGIELDEQYEDKY